MIQNDRGKTPTFVFHAPLQLYDDRIASELGQERLWIHRLEGLQGNNENYVMDYEMKEQGGNP
jgi:hypothetical protein